MTAQPILIRKLVPAPIPSVGSDVDGAARALHRYLRTGRLGKHGDQSTPVRETFGPAKAKLAAQARRKAGLPAGFTVDAALDRVLRKADAYDELARQLVHDYNVAHAVPILPRLVHPHAAGGPSSVCQGIHPTAGLDGNEALDFCAPGGTLVVAVIDCQVVKISGHSPNHVVDSAVGIFGWNIHYVSTGGYRWFSTHYGSYFVGVGQKLKRGTAVGRVGHWPNDPGRSHTHLGVTSPHGRADAIRLIQQVAAAPRVRVPG